MIFYLVITKKFFPSIYQLFVINILKYSVLYLLKWMCCFVLLIIIVETWRKEIAF